MNAAGRVLTRSSVLEMATTITPHSAPVRRWLGAGCALLLAAAVAASCGTDSPNRDGPGGAVGAAVSVDQTTSKPSSSGTLQLPKASLQKTLGGLFTEHVELVLATTGATAAGNAALADQSRQKLDKNTEDIVGAVVGVYGPDAAVFGQGWRMHVQAFVDYTAAGVAKDATKQADAKQRLDKYPKQVGAFLAGANPNLTQSAVADLVATHIADITGIIDQQVSAGANAVDATSQAAQHASTHMTALATALTGAIAKQFPQRFPS